MTVLTRPILEISLKNIAKNYQILQTLAKDSTCAAVVKDDAYGLGAKVVASFLYQNMNCRNFFVAHAVEGEELAPLLPDAKIYALQGIGADNLAIFKKNENLVPVISCPQMLDFWNENKPDGRKLVIHIETGLNRLGFREEELKALSLEQKKEFSLVMSHLACADEKDHFMNEHQLENFKRLKEKYFKDIPASLSASDGIFLDDDFHFELVRLGAAMYGINTAPYRKNQMQNVVTIKAPVIQIEDLLYGEFVGYSATYRANSDRKIAIVSIGYGDGVPRSLSNIGKVFFDKNGKIYEARIIGRVSMDNLICDITDIESIKVGDMAHIIDRFYTLDDIGRDAGTISYEVLSRIGKNKRFDRRYIK